MSENRYPAYDLPTMVDRLCPPAASKYRGLVAQLDEQQALVKLCLEHEKDIDVRRNVVASALRSSDAALPENASAIRRLQQQLDQLDAEAATLERKRARLNSARGNLDQTISHLQNSLASCYRAPAADPVIAAPREGESVADAIMRVRQQIMCSQQELISVRSAPWPAAEQRAWLRTEIARLQKDGPRLIVGAGGRPEIVSPDVVQFTTPGVALTAPSGSALRLMASLFPDELLRCLEQQIIEVPGGVPFADRPARVSEIEQEILTLEFVEESLIEQALAAGIEVHRRPQASAHAVLGLWSPLLGLPPQLELQAAE